MAVFVVQQAPAGGMQAQQQVMPSLEAAGWARAQQHSPWKAVMGSEVATGAARGAKH
jgi:hypothetical protein